MPTRDRIRIRIEDIKAGDWFLPVDLEGQDQHRKVPEALALGAAGYFYEEGRFHPASVPAKPAIAVESARAFYYELAREARSDLSGRFAAICGSCGKSTVKEMVASILAASGASHYRSPENRNTKLHLAGQLMHLKESPAYSVLEVGARRAGDLSTSLSFLSPQVVALLNIGSAHLGEFGSQEALTRAKLEALACPAAEALVVPFGDQKILDAATQQGKRKITFGLSDKAHTYARWEAGSLLVESTTGRAKVAAPVLFPGLEENAAAAAAVAQALGLSWPEITRGFLAFLASPPLPGRFEFRTWQGKRIIDDAFNSSPESLSHGLNAFFRLSAGQAVALVIGEMRELGENSKHLHLEAGEKLGQLAALHASPVLLITVGAEAAELGMKARSQAPLVWIGLSEAREAEEALREFQLLWSMAYVKGSKVTALRGMLQEAFA